MFKNNDKIFLRRKKLKTFILNAIVYLILIATFLIVIYPLFWTIMSSLKNSFEIYQSPISLPKEITFDNYKEVWLAGDFARYFVNTIIITSISLIGVLFLSTMAGYGFARYDFKGKDVLFYIFVLSLSVVSASIMISTYKWIDILGLLSTYTGIILVYLSWSSYGIIMSRQAFSELPQELLDAAHIDGCSEFYLYFKILLPLIRPTVATIGIFSGVWIWNDFIWPLLLLQEPDMSTVVLGILSLRGQYLSDWGTITAGLTLGFLPILICYFAFQKHFVKGLGVGALKQ